MFGGLLYSSMLLSITISSVLVEDSESMLCVLPVSSFCTISMNIQYTIPACLQPSLLPLLTLFASLLLHRLFFLLQIMIMLFASKLFAQHSRYCQLVNLQKAGGCTSMIYTFTCIIYSVTRTHAYYVRKYHWKKLKQIIVSVSAYQLIASCDACDTICS